MGNLPELLEKVTALEILLKVDLTIILAR